MENLKSTIFYVMGVSGSGKSTIGILLSEKLGIPFFDGDDFHPPANVQKMAGGEPLNDDDRMGWLQRLNELAIEHRTKGAVIACSALKQSYRDLLARALEKEVNWIFLEGSYREILQRLKGRKNHFMPKELLQSQFDTLELPQEAIVVSITKSPEEILEEILQKL